MKPATSIEKVCRIFAAFRAKPAMGITQVSDETGLLPSDVHRILRSLQAFGYIKQDEAKKYSLGLELLKLGHLVHERIELREVARPFLRHLSELAQATVNLAVFDPHDFEVVFIEQIDSPAEMQLRLRIGAAPAAHATGVGKVLLSHLDRETAMKVIRKSGLPKRTKYTITNIDELKREFEAVRSQGYALDREEAAIGACCIAAPVRDHRGEVVAAVSVSIMASRSASSDESRLIAAVQATAANISALLGHEDITAKPSRKPSRKRGGTKAGTRSAAV
jgi:DNA-binding IclR family transcriptional regulator